MRYPKYLSREGTIGFVAPSFGCATEPYLSAYENALANLEECGFSLVEGPNCRRGDGVGISAPPKDCGDEINDFYHAKSNDALISVGGGELMCEILEYIDFERIRKAEPKWFMGFSDNTNLAFLLTTLCDIATIYGPCAPAFGMEPWHPVLEDALGLLMGETKEIRQYGGWELESLKDEENPLTPYNITEETVLIKVPEGPISLKGRIIGGCLDCLENLAGTRFDQVPAFLEAYKEDGFIWYLESCDLNVFGIRRALWHLKMCGWFSYLKGFIIGRPYCYGQEIMGLTPEQAFLDVLKEFGVPVILNADLGHLPPSMPMVNGAVAEVESIGNDLTIRYTFAS